MALTLKQQTIQAVQKAENILIVFKNAKYGIGYPRGGDTIASALALSKILKKNNKKITICSPEFCLPNFLSFLPNAEKIKSEIPAFSNAEISINIKTAGLNNLSYKIDGDFLKINLEPARGALNLKTIKTNTGKLQYDLIIALGTSELPLLCNLYNQNKALFDNLPIINIDTNPQNEHYGEINLVDIKSSSVAEIIWQLIENSKNLDNDVVSAILTGIICKTKNFRKPNLSPSTLEIVGKLIKLGGQREKIVRGLYKTKNIETLRLWGKALSRLKQQKNIAWSLLTKEDLINCSADEQSLPDVIYELVSNSPETDIVSLIFERTDGTIKAILYSEKSCLDIPLCNAKHFAGNMTFLDMPYTNLIEAEKNLLQSIGGENVRTENP